MNDDNVQSIAQGGTKKHEIKKEIHQTLSEGVTAFRSVSNSCAD